MSQMSFFETKFWSVSEVTRYIREILESDSNLQDLWIQGEVSNVSQPRSGHLYFTLKDQSCSLRCVMWRSQVARQAFIPRDGEAIEVHGSVNVYEAGGQYQLYADLIRPAGEGVLYQEFLRLKALLEAEGLFEPERKRPIPRWPRRIGIVTSPTGAALRDILNTLQRRYALLEIVISPTEVQGDAAPDGIVRALERLNRLAQPDVILLARGGGSIEDLWAFNDERVARAVAASAAPVITGVGHETDFTIADFVCDLRAATPTAAAEMATPDRLELLNSLAEVRQRLVRAAQSCLEEQHWELNRQENRLLLRSPEARLRSHRQRLDDLTRRAEVSQRHRLILDRTRLRSLQQNLEALSPLAVLGRGFAMVSDRAGRPVRSIGQVEPGDPLDVRVRDGVFGVRVEPDSKKRAAS